MLSITVGLNKLNQFSFKLQANRENKVVWFSHIYCNNNKHKMTEKSVKLAMSVILHSSLDKTGLLRSLYFPSKVFQDVY